MNIIALLGLKKKHGVKPLNTTSLKSNAIFFAVIVHIIFVLCFVNVNTTRTFVQNINLQQSIFSIAKLGQSETQKQSSSSTKANIKQKITDNNAHRTKNESVQDEEESQNQTKNQDKKDQASLSDKDDLEQGSNDGLTSSTADYNATYQIGSNNNPAPIYPQFAIDHGIGGLVELEVEVLPSGKVGGIKIKKSSGSEILDISAKNTVKKWVFTVNKNSNKDVSIKMIVPIEFVIK
jgi:TonB family protein